MQKRKNISDSHMRICGRTECAFHTDGEGESLGRCRLIKEGDFPGWARTYNCPFPDHVEAIIGRKPVRKEPEPVKPWFTLNQLRLGMIGD